jgi:CRP-like cAMP-binding protein
VKQPKRLSTSTFSAASLGGTLARYQEKEVIYAQGDPASTLFYIQKGAVRLSTKTQNRRSAVTAILGVNDFFGELCLVGLPTRISSAVTLFPSSIFTINKSDMLKALSKNHKKSNALMAFLLCRTRCYKEQIMELLTFSAEERLACVLLRLAHLDKKGAPPAAEIPLISNQVLSEMVGSTRSRINLFMNRFRKKGFIDYDEKLLVRQSLREVLQNH